MNESLCLGPILGLSILATCYFIVVKIYFYIMCNEPELWKNNYICILSICRGQSCLTGCLIWWDTSQSLWGHVLCWLILPTWMGEKRMPGNYCYHTREMKRLLTHMLMVGFSIAYVYTMQRAHMHCWYNGQGFKSVQLVQRCRLVAKILTIGSWQPHKNMISFINCLNGWVLLLLQS